MSYTFHQNRTGAAAFSDSGTIFSQKVLNTLPFSVAEMSPAFFRKHRRLLLGEGYILALLPTDQVNTSYVFPFI